MKHKVLIITTILFFLTVNTIYFWESKLGLIAFPAFLLLVLIFLILSIILLQQTYLVITEKFEDKMRIFSIVLLTTVLCLTFLFPTGLFNFNKLSHHDILVAEREGAANCMTTFKMKDNHKFSERNVCFGVTEVSGNFKIINDTIYFENVELGRDVREFYEFAVVRQSKYRTSKDAFDLVRYKSKSDTTGHELWITKNSLNTLKGKSRTANSVFIKLWLEVKHSTINHYFASVVN